LAFNGFVWYWVVAGGYSDDLNLYFLDVGQGDSELIDLPSGRQILIDGGPDSAKTLEALDRAVPPTDRYLDAVIATHPQLDHFGGLVGVLEKYNVGVFIYNSRVSNLPEWQALWSIIKEKKIPVVALKSGDDIRSGDSLIKVVSPSSADLDSKEPNDTALVMELEDKKASALFTSDIGSNIEAEILGRLDLPIGILKVAHHGSKYSSSQAFIQAIAPRLSVIEVGKNSYGHPTREALANLLRAGSEIHRTDKEGTIHLEIKNDLVGVFTGR